MRSDQKADRSPFSQAAALENRPLSKRVEINRFVSQALNIPHDANPEPKWRMQLEHLNYVLSAPSVARCLSTLFLHLAQNLQGHVGFSTEGRAFRVHNPDFEIEFFNRVNEPLDLAIITYFLLKMRELVESGLLRTYSGELVNAATQASVWIRFWVKNM